MDSSLASYYGGWESYQRMLVDAIAPLDDEHLRLRAALDLYSVRKLANHIVATRAWWFRFWLGEGGPELDRMVDFEEGEESERRQAPEIVEGLEATWSVIDSCLRRWSTPDLDFTSQRPVPNAAGERPWRDRRYIIWHLLQHDLHHGGELSFSLGMHGVKGLEL
jgi:uncharacterized damage-inducible protein DinB